jgi:predicted PurR-regulated permease PerM
MLAQKPISGIVTSVVVLAGLSIVLLALREANAVLSPILLAVLLAVSTMPTVNWFIKIGAPDWLALVLTIILNIIVILVIVWLIANSVRNFADSLPEYQARMAEIDEWLTTTLSRVGVDADELASGQIVDPAGVVDLASQLLDGVAASLSNWGLILVSVIFILMEGLALPRKLRHLASENDPAVQRVDRFAGKIRQYMQINVGAGVVAALLNFILLLIVGVEFAVLWALLSFFLSFVPNVGFVLSFIPPAIMALLQFGPLQAGIVIAGYYVVNILVDSVIKPRYIQTELDLSPAVTFFSLLVWGWVLGPIGAILSIPMTMFVQALLESREQTRWMAYLLGDGQDPYQPLPESDVDGAEGATP